MQRIKLWAARAAVAVAAIAFLGALGTSIVRHKNVVINGGFSAGGGEWHEDGTFQTAGDGTFGDGSGTNDLFVDVQDSGTQRSTIRVGQAPTVSGFMAYQASAGTEFAFWGVYPNSGTPVDVLRMTRDPSPAPTFLFDLAVPNLNATGDGDFAGGDVTIGGRTLSDDGTYLELDGVDLIPGGGGGDYHALHINGAAVSTTSMSWANLMTYSLPADTFDATGDSVIVSMWGDGDDDAGSETIEVRFVIGSTVIHTNTNFDDIWRADLEMVRTGVDAQTYTLEVFSTGSGTNGIAARGTLTETESGTIAIEAEGQVSGAPAFVSQDYLRVGHVDAP